MTSIAPTLRAVLQAGRSGGPASRAPHAHRLLCRALRRPALTSHQLRLREDGRVRDTVAGVHQEGFQVRWAETLKWWYVLAARLVSALPARSRNNKNQASSYLTVFCGRQVPGRGRDASLLVAGHAGSRGQGRPRHSD